MELTGGCGDGGGESSVGRAVCGMRDLWCVFEGLRGRVRRVGCTRSSVVVSLCRFRTSSLGRMLFTVRELLC